MATKFSKFSLTAYSLVLCNFHQKNPVMLYTKHFTGHCLVTCRPESI